MLFIKNYKTINKTYQYAAPSKTCLYPAGQFLHSDKAEAPTLSEYNPVTQARQFIKASDAIVRE